MNRDEVFHLVLYGETSLLLANAHNSTLSAALRMKIDEYLVICLSNFVLSFYLVEGGSHPVASGILTRLLEELLLLVKRDEFIQSYEYMS